MWRVSFADTMVRLEGRTSTVQSADSISSFGPGHFTPYTEVLGIPSRYHPYGVHLSNDLIVHPLKPVHRYPGSVS